MFAATYSKICYLQKPENQSLTAAFGQILSSVKPPQMTLIAPLWEAFCLDTIFFLLKHKSQLSDPDVGTFLLDSLNGDFGLVADWVPQMVADLVNAIQDFALEEDVTPNCAIIEQIFWDCMAHDNVAEVALQTGASERVVRNMRNLVSDIAKGQGSADGVLLNSDITSMVCELGERYISQRHSQPWVADINRLGNHLCLGRAKLAVSVPLPVGLDSSKILDWLVDQCLARKVTRATLKNLGTRVGCDDKDQLGGLEAILMSADLLFATGQGKSRELLPSKLAYDLTSLAFACRILRRNRKAFNAISGYPREYQLALFRYLPQKRLDEALPFLNQAQDLDPHSLKGLVQRLAGNYNHQQIFAKLQPCLESWRSLPRQVWLPVIKVLEHSPEAQEIVCERHQVKSADHPGFSE